MASRQYGIPSGYREDARADGRTQAPSPPRQAIGYEPYSVQIPSTEQQARRSPPRRPVAPYERKPVASAAAYGAPPPPSHWNGPPSPSRQLHRPATAPNQHHYGVLQDEGNPYESSMNSHTPEPDYRSQYAPLYAPSQARPMHQPTNSQSSLAPLTSHAEAMPHQPPSPPRMAYGGQPAHGMTGYGYGYDQNMPGSRPYIGDGYDDVVDPRNIADDGDDGFEDQRRQHGSRFGAAAVAGAATGAGVGMRNAFGGHDTNGNYGRVPGGPSGNRGEKSEWLESQSSSRKRLKWIVGSVIALIIVAAVVGGVVGGILSSKSSGNGSSGSSSSAPSVSNGGDYDINSPQIQAVLNDKNLHKVFPGMDYTPLDAQYPACLTQPPNQNLVTLDVAILSQLTPAIRLYGTDCDQTQMVLKAIDKLEFNNTMKIWLGVWLENNSTTNERQLTQMYDILDTYPTSHFAGVIVGNEVLFREDMTVTQLGDQLTEVRNNLEARGIYLPVATSDLGDEWTAALAEESAIVMSNVHPFFAGVTADVAASWTWEFWQTHDVILTGASTGAYPNNIISETGWPSQGGNDCGTGTKCPTKTEGSIAGIDEMNTYMDNWVCQALANGTTYFWFEAFDEPWKVIYDTPSTGDYWEPHWGLLDVNRKLKAGLKIPDCGGKTIDKPY